MKKRIGVFGPKIDFEELEFKNGVATPKIDVGNETICPFVFQDGTILKSKSWDAMCWRGGRGIVKLKNVADETYVFIDKNGKRGEAQFAKINVNHPVFGFVLYEKNGNIMTFNGDENYNYPVMTYNFNTKSGYTTQLRRDSHEVQLGNAVTALKLNGMKLYYVLVTKEYVLPYEFKKIEPYIGYKCMAYVDKNDKSGVITLIDNKITLFEGLDITHAMTISVDYNQFLKLPLSVFEDESVVKGYMEIAKEKIRSEARTLPRKDWEDFQKKIAVFNEEVEARVARAIERIKENHAKEEEEEKAKQLFQEKIDSVGGGLSAIYESQKQKTISSAEWFENHIQNAGKKRAKEQEVTK